MITTLLALLQSVTIALTADLEIWPAAERDIQHRMWGTAVAMVATDSVRLDAFGTAMWWGSHESNIPGSFLTLESNKILERRYGARLSVGLPVCRPGAEYSRRGVEWIVPARVWGLARDTVPDVSIGYYDGLRGYLHCQLFRFEATGWSPFWTWKTLTLPWNSWLVTLGYRHGPLIFGVDGAFGGLRDPAVDFRLQAVLRHVTVGVAAGWIPHPGWEADPVDRFALTVTIP